MVNLYYEKTISVEGDWINPDTDNLIRPVGCYDVELSPIYAEFINAVKDIYVSSIHEKMIKIMDVIKSYLEEKGVNRKTIITFSKSGVEEIPYTDDFFTCDLSAFSNVFILEMATDEESSQMVVSLSILDLVKHNKARFIELELTALCKRINTNVMNLEYYYTEENDLENRRLEGDEYCIVTFGYSKKHILITADSLEAIKIDVVRKI